MEEQTMKDKALDAIARGALILETEEQNAKDKAASIAELQGLRDTILNLLSRMTATKRVRKTGRPVKARAPKAKAPEGVTA